MYARHSGGLGDAVTMTQGALQAGAAIASAFGPPGLIAAGIMEVGSLITGLFDTSLTGKQKIATTQIVNQLEPYLQQNVAAYMAAPTVANQQAALANFNQAWAGLVQACGQSQYGQPGQNCIADRNRGGKFDWWALYYDPIANNVPTDAGQNVAIAGMTLPVPLLIGGALFLVAVMS